MDPIQYRVIIIGASSGIGRRMAEIYAGKGFKVGISGRRKELLEEIQLKNPEQIEWQCFDVMGSENIPNIQSLIQKIGGLDLLIYSAGVGEISTDLNLEIDKQTVATNVNSFIEISNWGFNYFANQGHGTLVTISSVSANRGNSWAPAYSASKAFQTNYFEGLAIKAIKLKKDISVICIEPGFIDAPMAKGEGQFWIVSLDKAAKQMIEGIYRKRRKFYVSRRWWLVAKLMKLIPFFIYKKIG